MSLSAPNEEQGAAQVRHGAQENSSAHSALPAGYTELAPDTAPRTVQSPLQPGLTARSMILGYCPPPEPASPHGALGDRDTTCLCPSLGVTPDTPSHSSAQRRPKTSLLSRDVPAPQDVTIAQECPRSPGDPVAHRHPHSPGCPHRPGMLPSPRMSLPPRDVLIALGCHQLLRNVPTP